MNFKEYYHNYEESSKIHADNIIKYGPMVPFGYPTPLSEQLERIKFIVSNSTDLILELGSDSGYILNRCQGEVGIDISIMRIKSARFWYPPLNLVQAVAEHIPFRKAFNTVIIAELLEHVLDPEKLLSETHKILKKEGKVVITVPDEIQGKSHMNPEHLRKFSEGELRNLIINYFFIDYEEYIGGDYPSWCFSCVKEEILW